MMEPYGWRVEEQSPLGLAFIGDAVWEVYARNHCLARGLHKPNQLHLACTKYVSATAQAAIAKALTPLLSEEELDLIRRGRNAKSSQTRKNVDVQVYRHSTGWEMLIGHLYGTGQIVRLGEIAIAGFQYVDKNLRNKQKGEMK